MNEKVKDILKKMFWIILTIVFLELLLLLALEALSILSEYKLNISSDIAINEFSNMFSNLPTVINNYWQEKNPFFILGTLVVIVYSFVLHKGKFKKKGWETEQENAYHGSARWGLPNEIFDKKNFIKKSKKDIKSEFQQSLHE